MNEPRGTREEREALAEWVDQYLVGSDDFDAQETSRLATIVRLLREPEGRDGWREDDAAVWAVEVYHPEHGWDLVTPSGWRNKDGAELQANAERRIGFWKEVRVVPLFRASPSPTDTRGRE